MTPPDENYHFAMPSLPYREGAGEDAPVEVQPTQVLDNSFECGDCQCLSKLSGMEVLWTSCGKSAA
jgi:hypothetical protein